MVQPNGHGRAWQVYVVPGAHFDLGWCASIAETLAYGGDLIRRTLDELTGPHPDYRFTVEYALFLKHFLERYPDYRDTVLRLLDEGRLEVCCTMTGAMTQILDGEATVRVVADAQRWARRALGRSLPTAQHSDLPGHTIQVPQILAKCGVRNFAYSRFRPPHGLHWWTAPDGSRVLAAHHHTGSYGWGFTLLRPEAGERLREQLAMLDAAGTWPEGVDHLLMTGQADLVMLEPEVVQAAAELTREGVAFFRVSTLTEFFEAVAKQALALPTYRGEAPYGFYSLPAWEPDTYKAARDAEHRLEAGEVFASLCDLLALGRFPHATLEAAWEGLFYPQDHNVGGRHGEQNKASRKARAEWGATIGREAVEAALATIATHVDYPEQEHAWSRDPAVRRGGWTFPQIRTPRGLPVVVANPLAWPRTDVVRTRMEFFTGHTGAVRVVDDTGREVPSQVLYAEEVGRDRPALSNGQRSSAEIVFVARDVPGCGYRTYYLEALPAPAGLAGATQNEPVRDSLQLEGGGYRATVVEGRVTSLVERRSGRELVGAGVAGPAGTGPHRFGEVVVLEDLLVDLEDGPLEQARNVHGVAQARPGMQPPNFTGRAWTSATHPARVVAIERGPVQTRLVLASRVLDCPIEQEIVLYEHLSRIEITLRLDWHGQKNALVRASYPLAVPAAVTTYETPYGSVVHGRDEMPNTYRGEGTRFVQKWIDLSTEATGATGSAGAAVTGGSDRAAADEATDSSWGVTWSSKVCAHTLHVDAAGHGTGLSPLLVRSAYSCGTPFLWYTLEGRHEFAFALQAHEGTWRDSHTWRMGWEFHQPLAVARLATARPLAPLPGRDTLPQALSLCTLEGDHATVGTIHQPEADTPPGTYAVRLVEVEGRGGPARLTFCRPVRRAARTTLVGDDPQPLPAEGNRVTVDLVSYEIATILAELER